MDLAPPAAGDGGLRGLAGGLLWRVFAASAAMPSPAEAGDDASTARLKQVVSTVTECCRTTVLDPRLDVLVSKLDAYDEELHGFAYEGAGVGLAALDCLLPGKGRTLAFATGPGARHIYGIYLGAGMCLARIRRNPESFRARLGDPVLGWIVVDGYGFHESFFRQRRHVIQQRVPAHLRGYARRVFDQGMGRGIWFWSGADIDRVAATIGTFPAQRRPDLWSGVGFACGYSGGIDRGALEPLPAVAGRHRAQLALGAAITARIRHQGGNLAAHNELACEVLCGMTSKQAATVVEGASRGLPADHDVPAHALWRQRILRRFE
jgi:enediyne biosynthesis protein E3